MAAILLVIAIMPLWFPWCLRPLARALGGQFESYEHLGYSRFALRGVTLTNGDVRVTAERVAAIVPTVWMGRLYLFDHAQGPFVAVTNWSLTVSASKTPSSSSRETGVRWYAAEVTRIIQEVLRWVPTAETRQGVVRVPNFEWRVPSAAWSNGNFQASVQSLNASPQEQASGKSRVLLPITYDAILAARLSGPSPYEISLRDPAISFESKHRLTLNSEVFSVESRGSWQGSPFELRARFPRGVNLPDTAAFSAPDFRISSALLGLKQYGDVTGSADAAWAQGEYQVRLEAHAKPSPSSTNWPPASLTVRARGNTNVAFVDSATLSSPALSVELSRSLQLHRQGDLIREPASVRLTANLAEQSWLPLSGRFSGEANLEPQGLRLPAVGFRLVGTNVAYQGLRGETVNLQGSWRSDRLVLDRAHIVLGENSFASVAGEFQTQKGFVERGELHVRTDGNLLRQWLPSGLDFATAELSATTSGPFEKLSHKGHVEVAGLSVPELRPVQFAADWTGFWTKLEECGFEARAGDSTLRGNGSFELGKSTSSILMRSLTMSSKGPQPLLSAEIPFTLSFEAACTNQPARMTLAGLRLSGCGGSVKGDGFVAWPSAGEVRASVSNFSLVSLAEFTEPKLPDAKIQNWATTASWTNGPIHSRSDLSISISPDSATSLSASLRIRTGGNGVMFDELVMSTGTSRVAIAKGSLPLNFVPGNPGGLLIVDADAPLVVVANASSNAFFWLRMTKLTGVELDNPSLTADVSGTLNAPKGIARLQADHLRWAGKDVVLPAMDQLNIGVNMDRKRIWMPETIVYIQGNPVTLSASVPLEESFWDNWRQKSRTLWRQVSARLLMQKVQVANFAGLYPKLLAPQGEATVDISLQPGGRLGGTVVVEKGRTRPLPQIGALRDVNLRIRLTDSAMNLESATAAIGGGTVNLRGQVDLRPTVWQEELPPFVITVFGTNVPIARKPEAIIRTDLNLAIAKTNAAPPIITGKALLHNSFFLSDIRSLVSGGVTSVSRRPPYFSIEEPFLGSWRLNLDVSGQRWLRIRSPVFQGEASVNLKLEGTLKDPIATGEARIDSGTVRFPFGSLEVQQGFVVLSKDNPFRPELSVTATAKRYGFDVRMEATGAAEKPVLQFTSTPPLSSEQIILMLTAGQLPGQSQIFSTTQRAQGFAVYLGRDMLSLFGIGMEGQERLTVQSGENISSQGRPTYNLEYKLTPRWSLTGEYDRFNQYNAGVKWRVFSK